MARSLTEIWEELDRQYAKGRNASAEQFLQEAIQEMEQEHGKESREVASLLNEQGGLHREFGQYDMAEREFTQAKNILGRLVGENHPDYITTVNNLAGLYRRQNRFAEAKALFQEVLHRYDKAMGKDNIYYASALNNLGLVYQDEKEYETAIEYFKKGLAIVRAYDLSKPAYGIGMSNIGACYRELGQKEEAERAMAEAESVLYYALGEGHPLYKNCLAELQELRKEMRKEG